MAAEAAGRDPWQGRGAAFGATLRHYRQAAGLTQEDLAARSGLSVRGISDLERGAKQRPRADTLRMLADALGLSPADRAALAAAARPTSSLPAPEPAGALPVPPTPLVGRARAAADVAALLRDGETRLLTLTGPGGVGKTRLALAVTADLAPSFPDGAAFVPLAAVRDPDLVADAIARALGVRPEADRPLPDVLRAHLRPRRLLLVLDNVEQVRPAAPLVADLLAACPGLAVLATSRAPLRLAAEQEYPLPPLALPDAAIPPNPAALAGIAAVELFVRRARAARPDFALGEGNAADIAEAVRRLDGLPLAIELAAARLRALSPAALRALLDQRLRLLGGGPEDAPARQRTKRDTIAWSHDLLDDAGRALFRRVAVFAGGCTLEAVAAVAGDGDPFAALDGLAALAEQSLLDRQDGPGGEPRFAMLATVRDYGLEQLAASGEEDAVRAAHAAWFLGLAERAELELAGPEQAAWLDRLEAERDNFRAALAWGLAHPDPSADLALRLAAVLRPYWQTRGHLRKGIDALEGALARAEAAAPAARAAAHFGLGRLAYDLGDYPRARTSWETCLALHRQNGDQRGVAACLNHLGFALADRGETASARALLQESLAISRDQGDAQGTAQSLYRLGNLVFDEGDLAGARALYFEAQRHLGEPRDLMFTANLNFMLGVAARLEGDGAAATRSLEQALELCRRVGHRINSANTLMELGHAARLLGDDRRAERSYAEALALYQEVGARTGVVEGLESLGALAAARGRPHRAATLLGAATAWRAALDHPYSPPADRDPKERLAAEARHANPAAFAAGQSLPLERAVAEALARPAAPEAPAARP